MTKIVVITCPKERFAINCPSVFLKILKLPEYSKNNFKTFKNHEGDFSPKSHEPNM